MDTNIMKRNECLAKTVIKGLESRNMSGYYAASKEEALKQALELIPEESTIAMGGCVSAREIGLVEALEKGNYNYLDRSKMSPRESLMAAYDADIFLSSANAVTNDGILVNIDRKFQPRFLHRPGTKKSRIYCGHQQSLFRSGQCHETCEKRSCTCKCPEI